MTDYGNQQTDPGSTIDTGGATAPANAAAPTPEQTEADKALVLKTAKKIKDDRRYHKAAFEKMREDMYMARHGRTKSYSVDWYVANLCGRHIKQKTAALYAKNPKAVARRRETIDFQVWDENPKSLQLAMETIKTATAAMSPPIDPNTGQPAVDPNTGAPVMPQFPPEYEQALATAQATLADFQQGMKKRTMIQKIGKTLEILFAQALREQKPLDFKTGAKQLVRRALATGVGYIELGFQREYGPRPAMLEKLADYRARLDHLRVLTEKTTDTQDPLYPDDPEIAELQASITALQSEPEVIVREGLIVDFPQATKVIPDKLCQQLVGFVGARHVTLEYMYTCDEVREVFGVDLDKGYTGYSQNGKSSEQTDNPATQVEPEENSYKPASKGNGLVCVWKHYDKVAGLVYYLCDGYTQWLRPPAAPDVFVEDFWPVYALTFNEVESEEELFPPSDVRLMKDQQMDYNRSRQGQREHRKAARPRWTYPNGSIEKEDAEKLATAEAFTATGMNLPPDRKLSDMLSVIPVPGVDPNLYETNQLFTDIQLIVGSSEAQFGGTAKRITATQSAIAANSSKTADDSSIDDLDTFLTIVARASGQILLKEMSEQHVMEIAGPGALWPHMTLAQIADEIFLEVEAGSTGKPNQAVEINNWKELLPFLIQMPGVSPNWLARETVRRLDDNADLTEALSVDTPSVMAMNGLAQISTGNPATDPNAQGAQGGQNAPKQGSQTAGSGPAFGENKTNSPAATFGA